MYFFLNFTSRFHVEPPRSSRKIFTNSTLLTLLLSKPFNSCTFIFYGMLVNTTRLPLRALNPLFFNQLLFFSAAYHFLVLSLFSKKNRKLFQKEQLVCLHVVVTISVLLFTFVSITSVKINAQCNWKTYKSYANNIKYKEISIQIYLLTYYSFKTS